MAARKQDKGERIAHLILATICGLLVWRNLIQPARQSVAESIPSAAAAGNPTEFPSRPAGTAQRPLSSDPARRDKVMDEQELAALDPTLRLDLLEKTAQVQYQGSSRNIFQFYTPPPKPVTNPIVAPPQPTPQPVAPPPPAIPLKFYGMSSHPGTPVKKAFLTDGEEIYIGQEGDVVAKRYKIVRIGVNSLEWEDMQPHQHGQLPLVEE